MALCEKAITRIQRQVQQRRIRIRDFFRDFDAHRSNVCTAAQFARALDRAGIVVTAPEVDDLVSYYALASAGPRVEVNYNAFCEDIDEALAQPMNFASTAPLPSTSSPIDGSAVEQMLARLTLLCKTRGISLKQCFCEIDTGKITARKTPFQSGRVTRSQFIRLFPFTNGFPVEKVEALAEAFSTEEGDVNYLALHERVCGRPGNYIDPFARSDFIARPDSTEWSARRLTPMERLRLKVQEKRVRLLPQFQDFDPLRKGTCAIGQVKTVLTILDLMRDMPREDVDAFVKRFGRSDGMFQYTAFCDEAEQDYASLGMEKNPLLSGPMPLPQSPRRNRAEIRSESKLSAIDALHARLRSKIKNQRALLLPAFQDMDRTRRGHVTCSQFARVMAKMNLSVTAQEVELLKAAYCDLGNHMEMNYVDFCHQVDQTEESIACAALAMHSPASEHSPRYFDGSGSLRPLAATCGSSGMGGGGDTWNSSFSTTGKTGGFGASFGGGGGGGGGWSIAGSDLGATVGSFAGTLQMPLTARSAGVRRSSPRSTGDLPFGTAW